MPLVRIPASIANQNLRRRSSLWPDGRVPTDRLDGVVKIALQGSFTFSRADKIMTIGSCFAREIERRLGQLGFDIPMLDLKPPAGERESSFPNDLVNKYTIQSVVNEFLWAFGEISPPTPDQLFLHVDNGMWHDPHLIHNLEPAPLEHVIARREIVRRAFARLPECRIVVITLGLGEAWFDHLTGLHLNAAPPTPTVRREPDRFSLDLLSYDEILDGLETVHRLLRAHGHPNMRLLVTVSPVPFKATFTGVDALQANAYSKAVQRAACEAFVRRHEDVDYFPSYEIVTLTARETAFERDNIHVTAPVVAQIMDRVIEKYAPDVKIEPLIIEEAALAAPGRAKAKAKAAASEIELKRTAKFLAAERRYGEACDVYAHLVDVFGDGMAPAAKGQLHLDYGVALLRSERPMDGVHHLRKAVALLPHSDRAAFKLGLGYGRLKQIDESNDALRRAIELAPGHAGYYSRLALGLAFAGQKTESLVTYRRALEIDPDEPEAKAALLRAGRRSAA